MGQLPDAHNYATVWRRALDLSVSTPVVPAPLGATLATSFDASRTWYSFPHHRDALGATATLTRPLARNLKLFALYQASWSADVYDGAQALFYPAPATPLLTPDGTPYYGYAAFSGARTFRTQSGELQFTPNGTSLRVAVTHTADFPQFNGFGRPQWEVRGSARFRPFPNIGLDVSRAYDFAWGGTRWQPPLELRDHAVTHALAMAAAAAAMVFRIVPLACDGDRLVVAGAGVLRLAEGASCSTIVPGRAIAIALDADNRATPQRLTPDAQPAAKIPRAAFVLAPAVARDADESALVTSTVDVLVPPRTPPSDDIYISTERSSWSPAERMDRVDARHFRLALQLHRGARVAFRVTRGSYGSIERNAARALPPAHVALGEPDAHVTITVAAWADID